MSNMTDPESKANFQRLSTGDEIVVAYATGLIVECSTTSDSYDLPSGRLGHGAGWFEQFRKPPNVDESFYEEMIKHGHRYRAVLSTGATP